MRRILVVAPLVIWMLWVVILTLFPFDFTAAYSAERLEDILFDENVIRRWPDVVLNAVLFLPLGIWFHTEGQRCSLGLTSILILAAAAGALVSSVIECLQLFLPSRFPSLLDVVSNSAGGLMGVYAGRAWAAPAAAATARLRTSASPATVVTLMAGFAALALMVSAGLQVQTRLSNWDDNYPLLVGNERTGDRPWRGRIFTLELTDASTSAASLRLFADGGSPAISGARVAVFDFSGSAPFRDVAGHSPSLGWTGNSYPVRGSGVGMSERRWMRTEGAVSSIARRLRESNSFTLRVRCATDDVSQNGPARIVSNSLDPYHRNFTLGQSGRNLVFRFRTPHTGENGTNPEVIIPNVFSDDRSRDILVTYDGAILRAAVANAGQVLRFELSPGSSLAAVWHSSVTAGELQMYKFGYLAILFLPPGIVVGLLARNGRNRRAWSTLWVLGFTVLYESTLAVVSGRTVHSWGAMMTLAVGTLVLATTALISQGLADRTAAERLKLQPTAIPRPQSSKA